jgi:DNA-binding MarR family transcriptional regulator
MARRRDAPSNGDVEPASTPGIAPEDEAALDAHVLLSLAIWPQIDPAVEAIVTQIDKAERLLDGEMQRSLSEVGLTMEEGKVLLELSRGPRTHGELCRRLGVSTGAMTNRLDKLEGAGLVTRTRDPRDRRGVTLTITDAGSERIDAYVDRGSDREQALLSGLTEQEKRRLNALLGKLLASLRAELGDPGA